MHAQQAGLSLGVTSDRPAALPVPAAQLTCRCVCSQLPGMYPGAAGKIVSNVPYKGKEDMYSKCGFTAAQSEAVKKYDGKFIFLEPRPEYVIDNINNGLYR